MRVVCRIKRHSNMDHEERVLHQQIARCFPSRKNPTVCPMNAIQYNKLTTGGNDPKVSKKTQYSNYVKNFSKSRPVQDDVCKSIALHPTDMNPNNRRIHHTCSNPIFKRDWRMKHGKEPCFCGATNSIIGPGVVIL